MLELGAFARMWRRRSAEEIAAAMAAETLTVAQWNFSALGQPTISSDRTERDYAGVRAAMAAHHLTVWGLSCTYNLLDANLARRAALTEAAVQVIGLAPSIGATAVTICTGSRAPDGWTYHPDNGSAAAWTEMRAGLDQLLTAASDAGVFIGVEPEAGSIVNNAAACMRLVGEVGTGAPLRFVLDAWNLLAGEPARRGDEILQEAFSMLGAVVACLQAKDPLSRKFSGPRVNYAHVAGLHAAYTPGVPVVLQDVAEGDVGKAVAMMRAAWGTAGDGAVETKP
jgi:sugar phosphate isomerase/epimerase